MNGDSSGVLLAPGNQTPFEALKQINEHGAEYWSARDVQPLLGYAKWVSFHAAVKKAEKSCESSGNAPEYHFAGAGKMVAVGSGVKRDTADYHLSRFACYLIAQNGDPRKPEVAAAQKYFAIQTRRMELSDQQAAELKELEAASGEDDGIADEDDARERIQEDPLSLRIFGERIDGKWQADRFELLLTTGGPAVRIMGELDNGEPDRAWLEVQDWGKP